MPLRCRNHCDLYKDTKLPCGSKNLILFLEGYKMCRECEYFIKTTVRTCICCGGGYATTPRTGKSRRKLEEMRQIVRY